MKKRRKKQKVKREVLKKIVREKKVCYFCGTTENITEHHIIFKCFIKGGELPNNKKDICDKCHKQFHKLAKPVVDLLLSVIQGLQPKPTRKIGFIRTNNKGGERNEKHKKMSIVLS